MAEELITIKISEAGRRNLRLICAQHGLKQYEVIEVLTDAVRSFDDMPLATKLDTLLAQRGKK